MDAWILYAWQNGSTYTQIKCATFKTRFKAVLMGQALKNILQNALTYTPKDAVIEISAYEAIDGIHIRILDNGPGLPQEETERVFEKFYRADTGITGGTGLGLTISKSIVLLHGGRITASNRSAGTGAWFDLFLPF